MHIWRRSNITVAALALVPQALSIACIAALVATSASATTVMYADLNDLVAQADGIVVGTVTGTESRYGPDREIYTFVTFSELDALKGTYGQPTLTLRFLGGHVDGDTLDVEGSPRFALQDRVLLFVRGNGKDIVPIVGWTQGVFRIKANANAVENVYDHDGNRVLSVRGAFLLKERTHSPSLHIAGAPAVGRQSRTAKARPGVSDDGSPSAAARITPPAQAAELTLPAPSFFETVRQSVAGGAGVKQSTAEIRSVEDFDGVQEIPEGASRGGRDTAAAHSRPSAPLALPQRHLMNDRSDRVGE